MKRVPYFVFTLLICLLVSQSAAAETPAASIAFVSKDSIVSQAWELVDAGKFTEAETLLRTRTGHAENARARLEALDLLQRIRFEYSLTPEHLLAKLRKALPETSASDMERWAAESQARSREIDGQKFYFRREPQNIFLFSSEAIARRKAAGKAPESPKEPLLAHLRAVIAEADQSGSAQVQPVHHKFTHTITIPTNAPGLKPGAMVRAWLPFPQEYRQQREVKLISATPAPKFIAPSGVEGNPVSGSAQRSIYFEQRVSTLKEPLVFKIVASYVSYAFYPQLDAAKVEPLPDNWAGANLGERLPHIVFTPEIRHEVAAIVGEETNALKKALAIFRWVSRNIPWNAEDEYCIIPSFAKKAYATRRGDCGIQSTLFITMCRIAGIPARWQSGFETKPGPQWGMHDWAEIYLAPWGWLPADPSYGVQESDDPRVADFYLGHQDSYRTIVNLDWGRDLFPAKTSLRSEPADFQRGEVEIDGKNLYFEHWSAETDVERTSMTRVQ